MSGCSLGRPAETESETNEKTLQTSGRQSQSLGEGNENGKEGEQLEREA